MCGINKHKSNIFRIISFYYYRMRLHVPDFKRKRDIYIWYSEMNTLARELAFVITLLTRPTSSRSSATSSAVSAWMGDPPTRHIWWQRSYSRHPSYRSSRATSSGTKVRAMVTLVPAEHGRYLLKLRHLKFDPYTSLVRTGPWVTLVATHATCACLNFETMKFELRLKISVRTS